MCEKERLRYKMKVKRRYFGEVLRAQADAEIFEIFMRELSSYKSFCIYNSISSEADIKKIINALSAMGKEVYLPRVEGENLVAAPLGQTRKGAFGIEEPVGQALSGYAEVTVIPLLAVNAEGYRLGYGGGYYDRYLKGANTLKAGLGYYFQIEEFQRNEWDIPLDLYICERGIYRFE